MGFVLGLHSLAALQNSTGLGLTGSSPTGTSDMTQANLQNLATLANLSVSPGKTQLLYSFPSPLCLILTLTMSLITI